MIINDGVLRKVENSDINEDGSFVISEGVIYIGRGAFANCTRLTEITIPESVESIGIHAFQGCRRDLIISALKQNKNAINGLGDRERNDFTFLSSLGKEFGEVLLGDILSAVIKQGLLNQYRKLERLVDSVREKDKEKILNIIWSEKQKLGIEVDLLEEYILLEELANKDLVDEDLPWPDLEKAIIKIQKWIDKGFIPAPNIYDKIPTDKIDMFDKKIWFKLAKEPVFNISEETKMSLVELAYTFGVFEEDKIELRGKIVSELTEAEIRNGVYEDAQERAEKILELVHSGKLTNENLHKMFDGTDMKFKPEFYRFFLDNIDEILASEELMAAIPRIQRVMEDIYKKYGKHMPTTEEAMRYLSEVTYENINDGNERLAELCKLCGISQKDFEGYQEIYEKQKERKESSIPQVKGKNYEMLDLDDPRILLIGEGKFSKCCQKLHGAGESCMLHSAHSENGRIIEITDDDGTLIAQSWVWRNGNVVCFDSIEANAIESKKYSDADRKKLLDKIEKAYREAAEDMIKTSEEQVEKFRKKKLEEIEKLEGEERERALKALEEVCEGSKIKIVTVGKGYWPISQKITDRFADREAETITPRESVGYLNDSEIQYVVADAEKLGEIKIDDAKIEVKYRDKRRIEKERGEDIEEDTISKIRKIEKEAHKDEMQLMSDVYGIKGLSSVYGTEPERLRIISGEDWYLIYSNEEDEIHVHDLARGKNRFENEEMIAGKEIIEAVDQMIAESIESGKEISAELREDTSYLLLLRMKQKGLIEQIGEDEAYQFGEEYGEEIISEEEQQEMLKRAEEIRANGPKEESTRMHRFRFKPTEKYKARLKKRYNKDNDDVGGEI